jgi:hypothetical protein
VKRKNKLNCTVALIEAAFSPVVVSTEENADSASSNVPDEVKICATWFGNIPIEDVFTSGIAAKVAAGPKGFSNDGPPPPLVRIEAVVPEQDEPAESGRFICGKTGLRTFLLDNTKARSGILLKFVEPKDDHNEVIRCTWSANVAFVNKRICKANITLWKSAPPSARALTYESGGAETSAPETPVLSNYLTVEMSRLSEMIVQHCAHVSSGAVLISTLTTHWKIDKSDRLVFLWASGVTLRGGHGPSIPRGVQITNISKINQHHPRKFKSASIRKDDDMTGGAGDSSISARLLASQSSPIRPGQEFEKVPNRYILGYDDSSNEFSEKQKHDNLLHLDGALTYTAQSKQSGKIRPKRAAQSAPGGRAGAFDSIHRGEGSTLDSFNIDDDLDKLIDKDDDDQDDEIEDEDDNDDDEIRLDVSGHRKLPHRWMKKGGAERGSSAPVARLDPDSLVSKIAPQTVSETVKDVIKRAQSASVSVRPLSSPTSRHASSRSAGLSKESMVSPRKSSAYASVNSAVDDNREGKIVHDEDDINVTVRPNEPDVNSWRSVPSNMKTPAFSRILPLVGPKAHAQALAQGESERSSISVGRSVAHDPLWECPSCGIGSTASELASVSTLDVMRHYSTLLNSLRLQPRETQKLPNGARRRSDALDDCCYWPIDAAHVAAIAGGVGVYFAYVMPEGATRIIANEPYSTPYYIDKWLFQREERIHPSLPTVRQSENDEVPQLITPQVLSIQDNVPEMEPVPKDPFTLKQARRKKIDIQMMLAEEEELRSKSYKPVFSGSTPFTSPPKETRKDSPVRLLTLGIKHEESKTKAIEPKCGRGEKNGVEDFSSVLLGLSPQGRAIVRALSPTLARCFPSLSPSQINLMLQGKPVEIQTGPTGAGNPALISSVPVCSDCYCAYRAFADTLLSGQQPQQALEITSARFMRINGKVALRTEMLANSAGTISQLPDTTKRIPARTVMSAAQERQSQRKLEKESLRKPKSAANNDSKTARSSRSASRSAKSRNEEKHAVSDTPLVSENETVNNDELEIEERKLRLAKSALQEAQQMVAKIQAEKEATKLNQRELLLKAEAFVKRQETQREMIRAATEIRKRTAALDSVVESRTHSRPASAKPATSRPSSGKKKPGSNVPSRANSAKERQQQQSTQEVKHHKDAQKLQSGKTEVVLGPDGDDIFSSTTELQKPTSDSLPNASANFVSKPPRPSSAFASIPSAVSAISSSRHSSRPSSAQMRENSVTVEKKTSADKISVYEFMSGEASSSQLQLMQPSISSIASNDSSDSFSTPFAPMIQNSQIYSASSVVSLPQSALDGAPFTSTSLRPTSASMLSATSASMRTGAMLAGADWMDFYRKELNNRLGHLAPKILNSGLDSTSSTISSHSGTSIDFVLPHQQPPPPVSSVAVSPHLQESSQSQQQLQQMPHVFENAIKNFRESLKVIGASSLPPPYTPLSSTLGLLNASSVVLTPDSEPIQSRPSQLNSSSSNNSDSNIVVDTLKVSKSNSRPNSGAEHREPFSTLTGSASILALRKELNASLSDDYRRNVSRINLDVENAKPSSSISDAAYQRLLGETTLRAAAASASRAT